MKAAHAAALGRGARRASPALLRLLGALVALVAVMLIGALRNPEFLTPENVLNVLRQNAVLALLAVGMTIVIVSGGIDLSVGSVLSFTSVLSVVLARYGIPVAVVGPVIAGIGLGLLNGFLVARLRLPPFIATLAMLLALRGLTIAVFGEETVPIKVGRAEFVAFGRAELLGVPMQVPVIVAAFLAGFLLLRYSRFGRAVHAIGGNEDSARLLGIRVERTKTLVYAISGGLAGLAGVLFAARISAGMTNYGLGLELDAITAVALGGTLLTGGVGGVGGTFIGVLLVGFLFNLFNIDASLNPFLQRVVRGLLLTIVVVLQGSLLLRRR
ncbi:MAG: ABC transporter permease [Rhizobiales bacterium]|nr:ABC transporter permease [Hyphomicrobiales bacterium]